MCFCCPPAIQALFCLWVRSGFSKETVAGALTFFPPEPPLYKFTRISKDGEPLPEGISEEEAEETLDEQLLNEEMNKDNNSSNNRILDSQNNSSAVAGFAPEPENRQSSSNNEESDHDIKSEKEVNPAKMLTARAAKLREKSKIQNAIDLRDRANGVTYNFIPDPRLQTPPHFDGTIEAVKIGPHSKKDNFVAAVLYRLPHERQLTTTRTIIYSHGNATDIGAMNYMQSILANGLQANVLMYDYSGYGFSGGVPEEQNTYDDIKMVYEWVVDNVVEKNESKIFIYGQSIGSGPSCFICNEKKDAGGLILHSPIMSGMRVLTSSRLLSCLDIFPNIERIKKVKCPVMVIHGILDEEVDISHGYNMHEAVPDDLKRDPWWVPDRGHNDITEGRARLVEYIAKLRKFLSSV
mmetsp:Transcript_7186/g.10294  ORF Transcript_7186/g.10294 Transcript_7186/m.10294 type:complete len:408 (+) Transcript_7186:482-1705(+)